MRLGLIGLPMSGKTTVFNALTGANRPLTGGVPGKLDVQMAVVGVPDPRLDSLTDLFNPKKKVPAQITYVDIGGLAKGISEGGLSGPFRNELSQQDAFLQVIRAFQNPNVPHPEESIDPARDQDILESEFILSDLITVEKRMERLREEMSKGKNRADNQRELDVFERLRVTLEENQPLRTLEFSPEEEASLRGYGFLSQKPKLLLLNTDEAGVEPGSVLHPGGPNTSMIALAGRIEMEISELEGDDAALFMAEYGISEPTRDRVIRESYHLLNVQTFFTVGDDECRAWPHPIGSTAPQAAGRIHSDLERGFIAAEVVHYDLLMELGGWNEAKKVGKLRVEGKTYIMHDGDVMSVRFNV